MSTIHFKTPENNNFDISVNSDIKDVTISDLQDKISQHVGYSADVTFLYKGQIINHEKTLGNIQFAPDNDFFVVLIRQRQQQNQNQTEEYIKTYTGQEVLSASLKNGDLMFNVIKDIAATNPFFLSYIALSPSLAKKELMTTLENPEFKLTIKGQSECDDPIRAINMHPSGDNGYEIDARNVEFLISQSGRSHDFEKAKEIYLYCDRDIQRTLTALGSPTHIVE